MFPLANKLLRHTKTNILLWPVFSLTSKGINVAAAWSYNFFNRNVFLWHSYFCLTGTEENISLPLRLAIRKRVTDQWKRACSLNGSWCDHLWTWSSWLRFFLILLKHVKIMRWDLWLDPKCSYVQRRCDIGEGLLRGNSLHTLVYFWFNLKHDSHYIWIVGPLVWS